MPVPASDPTPVVLPVVLALAAVVAVLGVMWKLIFKRTGEPPTVVLADGEILQSALPPASIGDPYQAPAVLTGEAASARPPALPVGNVPVWMYRPLDLLGAGFVFIVFAAMAIASSRADKPAVDSLNPAVLVINIGFQFLLAGILFLTVMFRVGLVEWLGLRWSRWYWAILIGPGAVIGMWLLFGGLQMAGYMEWLKSLGVDQIQDSVELLQKSNNPVTLALMAVAAVFVAPLCEEIVFRGYFYPVLKRFGGLWVGGFCSALLFSCAHGNLMALLPLFIFGVVQVVLYEKTGSLWAPISVHFCFNGASVLLQFGIRWVQHHHPDWNLPV